MASNDLIPTHGIEIKSGALCWLAVDGPPAAEFYLRGLAEADCALRARFASFLAVTNLFSMACAFSSLRAMVEGQGLTGGSGGATTTAALRRRGQRSAQGGYVAYREGERERERRETQQEKV